MTMQNTDTKNTVSIEPIEVYLQRSFCPDKLALYQPIIDLIKNSQMFSVVDSLNAIVDKTNEQTPFDIMDELNDILVKYLRQLIAEFDIICNSQDIIFLKDIYESLQLLDVFDQHETVINICNNEEPTIDRLYELVTLIKPFDEMDFKDRIVAVPLMLFDQLLSLHTAAIDELKDKYQEQFPEDNVILLRKIERYNPQSLIISLIREQYLVPGMSAEQLTDMVASQFTELDFRDNKRIATELIALYLLTGETSASVLKTVQAYMEQLIDDVSQAHGIFSVLQSTMNEIKAHD